MNYFFGEKYHNWKKTKSTKFVRNVDIVFYLFIQFYFENPDAQFFFMTQFFDKTIASWGKSQHKVFWKKLYK